MESSWSYDCAGKGFMLSNEIVTPPDFLNARTRNGFTNWGLMKGPYGYDVNTMLLSSHQNALENQGNLEVGFIDMIRKQSPHDSLRNCLSSNGSGGGDVINMQTIAANAISGEEESSSKLSNSANSRDSSLIDLKLGRFGDNLNYHTTIRSATVMSSSDSSTPAKRVKACSLNSQAAFCQVYGCYKDLSSSKDYHKRHKVCDVHSKTAKVVVNGLEQRFCQQCSRFHLLGEFDDGKRSCRRRLAGHNERRRKPQVGFHSGRAARLLHAYNGFGGTRPDAATVSSTSFICQDILPSHTHPEKCKHPKLEDSADFASKLACNWVDGHVLQKSVYPSPYGSIMKQCPHSQSLMTASVFNDHQYHPRDNNVSCSLFQNNVFDTASTVSSFPELSSKPGCALSLLSSQPQSSNPLIMPVNVSLHNFGISDGPFGVSSKYPLYRVPNSIGGSQLNPVDLSNGNTIDVGSGFNGGFFNGSEYVNVKDGGPSFDDEATIDLLQLSSQLQRVEHQRQAVSVKQEDKSFCYLKIT